MKFEADIEQLIKSLTISDSILVSKNVNPLLSNCLFIVTTNGIEIISTDNELGIRTTIPINSERHFSFLVNAKRLISILKEIPKGFVTIEVDDKYNVNILKKGIKGIFTLLGMPKENYPELPDFEIENSIEIEQCHFKDLLRKVSYAASTDSIQTSFSGVYLVSENEGYITAVASDSKRLSLYTVQIKGDTKLKEGVIIPLKTIHEAERLLSAKGVCKFLLGKNQCFFKIGDTEIISKLVDGQFPNYKQVIPKEHSKKILINKEILLQALRRILIFTKEPVCKVIMEISKEIMQIKASAQELGEAKEEIEITSDINEKIEIGLSAKYIIDTIKEIDTEDVEIHLSSNLIPIVITPKEDNAQISVIMPIKIKGDRE